LLSVKFIFIKLLVIDISKWQYFLDDSTETSAILSQFKYNFDPGENGG
jgi:hypothetical protein